LGDRQLDLAIIKMIITISFPPTPALSKQQTLTGGSTHLLQTIMMYIFFLFV
jgi:hypothetical protein